MTNGDKIRQMSDEELANIVTCPYEFFLDNSDKNSFDSDGYKNLCLKWLKQEAEE